MRIDPILESRDPPERLAELARLAKDSGLGERVVPALA